MNIVEIFPHFLKGEKIRRASWAKGFYMYKDYVYVYTIGMIFVNGLNGDYVQEWKNVISEATFSVDDIMGADWELLSE